MKTKTKIIMLSITTVIILLLFLHNVVNAKRRIVL